MSKEQKHKIIYIEWDDSARTAGWMSQETIEASTGIAKCSTVGFLVEDAEDYIALSLSSSRDATTEPHGDIICIPKSCITKRKRLRR